MFAKIDTPRLGCERVCHSINFWGPRSDSNKIDYCIYVVIIFPNLILKVIVVLRTDLYSYVHQSTTAAEAAVSICIYLYMIWGRVIPFVFIRICPYLSVSVRIDSDRICMLIDTRIYPYLFWGSRIYSDLLVYVVQKNYTPIYCICVIYLDTWKIRGKRRASIFGKEILGRRKHTFLKGRC